MSGLDGVTTVMRGRFQPFGHQHAAAYDALVRKTEQEVGAVDQSYILVEDLSESRFSTAPWQGDELAEAIQESWDEFYSEVLDTDYNLEVKPHSYPFQRDVWELFEENPVYVTREEGHKKNFEKLQSFFDSNWEKLANAAFSVLPGYWLEEGSIEEVVY